MSSTGPTDGSSEEARHVSFSAQDGEDATTTSIVTLEEEEEHETPYDEAYEGSHDDGNDHEEEEEEEDGEEEGEDDDEESVSHSDDGEDVAVEHDVDDVDDDEEEIEEEEAGGGLKSSDGQELSGLARTQRGAHVVDSYAPPSIEQGATSAEVLGYFRRFVEQFNLTPPRDWRQIRFDLPATVAELKLYPPQKERTQNKPPIHPTTTIIMKLEGLMPADISVEDYTIQMIQYMFDVMQYLKATTAMTSVRFVKKGASLTQMAVTFGRDQYLATHVLRQVREAGIPAGFSLPTQQRDMQPNATFQVRDYKFLLNDGRGISSDQVLKFLTPFRETTHDADILVIDGFEPGLFFAPAKRPESVFTFLWNPTVSVLMQRFLFEKYGVLITQASCPHEFLQKGIPYYLQKQQKEVEKQLKLEEKAKKDRHADAKAANRNRRRDGSLDADDAENQDDYERTSSLPAWARQAGESVDIFGFDDPITKVAGEGSSASGSGSGGSSALKDLLKSTATARAANAANAAPVGSAPAPGTNAAFLAPPLQQQQQTGFAPYGGGYVPPGAPMGPGYAGAGPYGPMNGPSNPQSMPLVNQGGPDGDDDDDEDDRIYQPTAPVRRFQMAKLDPGFDDDEEQGRSGANAGGLFLTDITSSVASTDLFKNILEPRSRAQKLADRAAASATTTAPGVATDAHGEPDMYAGFSSGPSAYPPQHEQPPQQPYSEPYRYGQAPPVPLAGSFENTMRPAPQEPPRGASWESPAPSSRNMNANSGNVSAAPQSMPPNASASSSAWAGGRDSIFSAPPPGGPYNSNNNGGGRGGEYAYNNDQFQGPYGGGPQQQSYYQDGGYGSYGEGPYGNDGYGYGESGMDGGYGDYYNYNYNNNNNNGYYNAAPPFMGSHDEDGMLPPPGQDMNSGAVGGAAAPAAAGGGSGILGNAYMQPAAMPVDEADRLVVTIEEHLRNAFPKEYDAYMARVRDVQYTQADGQEVVPLDDDANRKRQNVPVMAHIPPESASLPYRSDELEALTLHIESEYARVVQLLQSRYVAALTEPRRRLLHCLLFALPAEEQEQDWIPRLAEDDDDEEEEEEDGEAEGDAEAKKDEEEQDGEHQSSKTAAGQKKKKASYVPALLPYCLASDEGTTVVRNILQLCPLHVMPLLARYVLPFLLDGDVVSAICGPMLYLDPRAENPLFSRVLQHWSILTAWVQQFAAAQVMKEAAMQSEHDATSPTTPEATTHDAEERTAAFETSVKAVRKRLASQLGNTLEQVLAGLSFSQRVAARGWNDAHGLLDAAFPATAHSKQSAEATIDLATGMWDDAGAVTRTLLRLYLNADAFDGRHLLEVLQGAFGGGDAAGKADSKTGDAAQHALHSEAFFYFARALVTPGRASAVLSRETAAFCGAYVRTMEAVVQRSPSSDVASSSSSSFQLGEKELVQLVTSAVRTLEEAAAPAAAHMTTPGEISSAAVAFEALKVAYNSALSFESSPKAGTPPSQPHTHLPAIQHILDQAKIPVPLPPPLPQLSQGLMMPVPLPHGSSSSSATAAVPDATNAAPAVVTPMDALAARWQPEWTRKMNLYPAAEEPFTPLPTGWVCSLSRSYGHYYFKPPGGHGSPTYRHPTDATEFMAAPQAFLHEPGTSTSLDAVRKKANELLVAAHVGTAEADRTEWVTAEQAKAWFADQRKRELGLDVATLELLQVHYRLGGQRRTQRESGGGGGGGDQSAETAPPVAVSRRVEHTEEELAALLARSISARQHYPAKGYPFPGLFKGWTVNMSALNGLYSFQPPRAPHPTIRHPQNRHYYRAAPQAFVAHRNLSPEDIAKATNGAKSVADVERWLADQRTRDRVLDKTVCDMVKVHYMAIPDIDEPRTATTTAKSGPHQR